MNRRFFFNKPRRNSKSQENDIEVSQRNSTKQQTLSKFFSNPKPTKKNNTVPETDEKGNEYEVKVNSPPKKRQHSDDESPEYKRSKVLDAADDASSAQSRLPTGSVSPGDHSKTHTTSDGTAKKVSESTLEKLSSYISYAVMNSEDVATPSGSGITLASIKQRLNYNEEKIYNGSQDSGVFSSQQPNSESDGETKSEDAAATSRHKLAMFSRAEAVTSGSSNRRQQGTPPAANKPSAKVKYTPLEQQFVEIKQDHQDAVLFVECGYKYRFFGEDAEIAAKELNIYCHLNHSFMTASIPVHRLHVHVRRLVAKGYKVGVVKQTETAALKAAGVNKTGPFTRRLSALYTKSTLIGEDIDPVFVPEGADVASPAGMSAGAYLLAVYEPITEEKRGQPHRIAVVAVHPSTGDLVYDEFEDSVSRTELEMRISHIGPVELLLPQTLSKATEKTIQQIASFSTTPDDRVRLERLSDAAFSQEEAVKELTNFYNGNSATSSRLSEVLQLPKPVICCLSGLLGYLKEFKLQNMLTLTSQFEKFSQDSGCLRLNASSLQNLEVFQNGTDGKERGSLFWVIDQTCTKFGRRKLRQWLAKPLLNICDIEMRLDAVQCIIESPCNLFAKVKVMLYRLPDLEKGLGTIYHKKCSTGEFLSVCKALENVRRTIGAETDATKENVGSSLLTKILRELPDLLEDIQDWTSAIEEKAAREGDKTKLFVREEDFPAIVERKHAIQTVLQQLRDHRKDVRQALRIPALDYVSVSGVEFLVEVKNTNLKLVPKDWIKISSTKAVSRFHTPFIVSACKKLGQLKEQLKLDCDEAWKSFLELFEDCYIRYKQAIQHLAVLDCLMSLAQLARQESYHRPSFVKEESQISIEQGRHPVVNALLGEQEQFVPNDTDLEASGQRCMIITGPNMGGKSSYIKQVCLVVVMAQMGSYVPAQSATLGIFDAIYTRMGATDELFKGRSTFMVELQEASDIMASATRRSLVILDELGRGTSTHDGVAIAHATLRHFIEQVACMTLFVTHYPPLTELEATYPGVVGNYHMAFMVNEESEDYDVITFLYQLVHGKAESSYGLNVARLAELPAEILKVAALKSKMLETEVMNRRRNRSHFSRLLSADSEMLDAILKDLQTTEDSMDTS